MITEVALTPLASRNEAESSIAHTQTGLQKTTVNGHGSDDSDTDGEEGEFPTAVSDDVEDDEHAAAMTAGTASPGGHNRTSSVAEDVLTRKGGYGRFASKWFSKRGWTVDQRKNLGMSIPENENVVPSGGKAESPITVRIVGFDTPTNPEAGCLTCGTYLRMFHNS
jgi:hypothetical protein